MEDLARKFWEESRVQSVTCDMLFIPDGLVRFATHIGEPGIQWLDRLPQVVDACVRK